MSECSNWDWNWSLGNENQPQFIKVFSCDSYGIIIVILGQLKLVSFCFRWHRSNALSNFYIYHKNYSTFVDRFEFEPIKSIEAMIMMMMMHERHWWVCAVNALQYSNRSLYWNMFNSFVFSRSFLSFHNYILRHQIIYEATT